MYEGVCGRSGLSYAVFMIPMGCFVVAKKGNSVMCHSMYTISVFHEVSLKRLILP